MTEVKRAKPLKIVKPNIRDEARCPRSRGERWSKTIDNGIRDNSYVKYQFNGLREVQHKNNANSVESKDIIRKEVRHKFQDTAITTWDKNKITR